MIGDKVNAISQSEVVRASIVMAVYNGEKYIKEQLDSIIVMLGENDEIVISYDESSDSTYEIVMQYKENDKRIKVFKNELKKGTGGNFQNAVNHCNGKYIFFADQDDVWLDDKINYVVKELEESGKAFAVHDGFITDKNLNIIGQPLFGGNKISTNPFRIWIKNRGITLGCCEAFRSEYLPLICPFPNDDHDVWSITICSIVGGIHVIYKPLILHRIHGGNVSKEHRRPILIAIVGRLVLMARILRRLFVYKVRRKKEVRKDEHEEK